MKIRKITAMLLAFVMVLCLVPVSVFAEAPEEPEETLEHTIVGWFNDGWSNCVESVKINGEVLPEDDASLKVAPGETLSIAITLKEGCALYPFDEDEEVYLILYSSSPYHEYVSDSFTSFTVPDEEELDESAEFYLVFIAGPEYRVIDKVDITAPIIKEGEGYTITETHEGDYTYDYADPIPEVTVPDTAPYFVEEVSWVVPAESLEDNVVLGYALPTEDEVFEKGEYYYIAIVLLSNVVAQPMPGPKDFEVDDTAIKSLRLADTNAWYFFLAEQEPQINVKNGELVAFYIPSYEEYEPERSIASEGSVYMEMVIRVKIDDGSPNTGEMNPAPWVWTMVLSISVVLTAIYYELEDIKRAYKR